MFDSTIANQSQDFQDILDVLLKSPNLLPGNTFDGKLLTAANLIFSSELFNQSAFFDTGFDLLEHCVNARIFHGCDDNKIDFLNGDIGIFILIVELTERKIIDFDVQPLVESINNKISKCCGFVSLNFSFIDIISVVYYIKIVIYLTKKQLLSVSTSFLDRVSQFLKAHEASYSNQYTSFDLDFNCKITSDTNLGTIIQNALTWDDKSLIKNFHIYEMKRTSSLMGEVFLFGLKSIDLAPEELLSIANRLYERAKAEYFPYHDMLDQFLLLNQIGFLYTVKGLSFSFLYWRFNLLSFQQEL